MINTKTNNNFAKCYLKNILSYNYTSIYTKEVATKIIATQIKLYSGNFRYFMKEIKFSSEQKLFRWNFFPIKPIPQLQMATFTFVCKTVIKLT